MREIDGSRYSGSGTIVRQAVAYAALTGQPLHVVNARARRDKPGLRRQHVRVVEAIAQLVSGTVEGLDEGCREFVFRPGMPDDADIYQWDIGSAGSTTMLALAILPVLAFRASSTTVSLQGGLFQDFAPTVFHTRHVMAPLLKRMGLEVHIEMERPGYVPRGEGRLRVAVNPLRRALTPLVSDHCGAVERIWGIALASHLAERRVSSRMAASAMDRYRTAGYQPDIEILEEKTAAQRGAALAMFADCAGGARLGADQSGAPGRPAEAIGRQVARRLIEDLQTGATLDRFAADQIIPFAALADGESRFSVPQVTDHMESSAWLAALFCDARVHMQNHALSVRGCGFFPRSERIMPPGA